MLTASFIMRADGKGFVKKIAGAPAHARIHYDDEITGWRGWLVERDATTMQEWIKWGSENPKGARTLKYLMYSTALIGMDLSKPYCNRWSNEERASDPAKKSSDSLRKEFYESVRVQYDALGDQGRRLYISIRDNRNLQRPPAVSEGEQWPPANPLGADTPIKMAAMPSKSRQFWRVLAALLALYMGALYLNHQAHLCFVMHGYSYFQDKSGYHLCEVRPWYWFW